MKQQDTLVVNGRAYDPRSGLPMDGEKVVTAPATTPKVTQSRRSMSDVAPAPKVSAKNIHRSPQRAQTLARSAVSKQGAGQRNAHATRFAGDIAPRKRVTGTSTVAQSEKVQRFAPAAVNSGKTVIPQAATPQRPATSVQHFSLPSKLQQQAQQTQRKVQTAHLAAAQTSAQQKEALIARQLAAAPSAALTDEQNEHLDPRQRKVRTFFAKQPRMVSAMTGMAAVLVLIGYVTFLNMPAISMRVAVSRAGFDATMPGYKPSGYSLSGPVAYSPGQVSLKFASNTNSNDFTLTQKQSSWDSKALLDNFVTKQSNNYLTYQEKGLTVYMYDGKAAWVNGGVWYNVEGSSQLSSDQILKLATSM